MACGDFRVCHVDMLGYFLQCIILYTENIQIYIHESIAASILNDYPDIILDYAALFLVFTKVIYFLLIQELKFSKSCIVLIQRKLSTEFFPNIILKENNEWKKHFHFVYIFFTSK